VALVTRHTVRLVLTPETRRNPGQQRRLLLALAELKSTHLGNRLSVAKVEEQLGTKWDALLGGDQVDIEVECDHRQRVRQLLKDFASLIFF
jgi:hypothetical protein